MLFCRNLYCSWTSTFGVCVCGITILVILFRANTLINFQFGSAAAVLYFIMSSLKKYKSEFLSHSEAKNSAWERPGFEQQNPGKLEPRCVRGAEVGSWHSSWLSQKTRCCPAHIIHMPSESEMKNPFSTLRLHKTSGIIRETCAAEDNGISNAVLMFLNMFPTLLSQVLKLACILNCSAFGPQARLTHLILL